MPINVEKQKMPMRLVKICLKCSGLSVKIDYCNFVLIQISFLSLQCPILHCQTIKNVLQHQKSCYYGTFCQEPHCPSNNEILRHWTNCINDDCPVCKPYKKPVTAVGINIQPSVSFQSYYLFLFT